SEPEATAPKPRYKLRPWQVKFAAYLADADSPSIAAQEQVAAQLAGKRVSYGQLKYLRARQDFRDLLGTLAQGGIEAARELFINDLPTYRALHLLGAQKSAERAD